MLGFPIRTSSDHSSVDSSPRLIAASYVLHRLLVPRHPPYALHYLQQRCSRPLCSSQTTHNPRTPVSTSRTPTKSPQSPIRGMTHIPVLSLLPREETLACSLRTQQYADIICSPTSTEAGSNENECLSASTHEQPPFHIRERNGLCFPQPHLCAASERDAP